MTSGPGSPQDEGLRPLDVVRAFHARLESGRPLHGLVHERFERMGTPGGALVDEHANIDEALAQARRQGFSFHVRSCEQGPGGRVLATGAWSHEAPLGGSAGLVYAVYETLDGQIVLLRFFDDRAAARAFAGLPG